ncbi:threonylcarbamoyl-AMP synthase [Candidatus Micrarchaeota archaeon]|nr:threonylcarbamoyl-AMP synthase [Candidatus Micrarchaeota archaeon]MBU1166324.1 threonylcarbamoyl-AMP synthase [Candidatus Micrarchaeota archaeon]MBU1886424.1 threonylcarbamoyl-AMP synthase [Candidatus Micrarchaeota archaeon]
MTTIIKITPDDFESAVDIAKETLKSGGIIVYPTDTLYGIGCDATSEEAVRKVHTIKGTWMHKPLSVMVSDFSMIEYYCDTWAWEDMIIRKYLPGPHTFILKKKREIAASESDKLGVRMPDLEFCLELCKRFGKPIVTTSANATDKESPFKIEDVNKEIIDSVSLVIDGGPTKYRKPSGIIDLVEKKIIRKGFEDINLLDMADETQK